jgi:predicted DCC family thiol-disulfide oxidoreductase YuxK
MSTELTVYYDGNCPFCAAEMARLRGWNRANKLAFVDVAEPGFDPAFLGVTMADLDRELHSRTADGKVLVGIDSMLSAYTLVGKAWMVLPLRVRPLRPVLSAMYRFFARNRYKFSAMLGYKPVTRCEGNVCTPGNPFLHRRGS